MYLVTLIGKFNFFLFDSSIIIHDSILLTLVRNFTKKTPLIIFLLQLGIFMILCKPNFNLNLLAKVCCFCFFYYYYLGCYTGISNVEDDKGVKSVVTKINTEKNEVYFVIPKLLEKWKFLFI